MTRGEFINPGDARLQPIISEQRAERLTETEVQVKEFAHLAAGLNNGMRLIIAGILDQYGELTLADIRQVIYDLEWPLHQNRIRHRELDFPLSVLSDFGIVTLYDEGKEPAGTPVALTDYGKTAGISYVARAMPFALEDERSLKDYWGVSTPRDISAETIYTPNGVILYQKRDAETRYAIVRALSEAREATPPGEDLVLRQTDVGLLTDMDREHVKPHIVALAEEGIIDYEAVDTAKDSVYAIRFLRSDRPQEPPSQYQDMRTLTDQVFRHVLQRGRRGPIDTVETTVYLVGGIDQVRGENFRRKREKATSVLAHLTREHYLTEPRFDHLRQSEVTVTAPQGEALARLVTDAHAFMQRDPNSWQEERRDVAGLLANPANVVNLLSK